LSGYSSGGGGGVLAAKDNASNDAMLNAFLGDAKSRLKSAKLLSGEFQSCACVMVLPSALSGGNAGAILSEVQEACAKEGLSVSALRTAAFTRAEAEEFLEVYKGVVPEYVVS
jgi:nucleoside-diphosphate kinase